MKNILWVVTVQVSKDHGELNLIGKTTYYRATGGVFIQS